MKSIIQEKKECFICRVNYDVETTNGLHEHHIFEGISRRRLSEKYGLEVYLCYRHHNFDNHSVHYLKALDLDLKRRAQKEFKKTHTREEFIVTFFKVIYKKQDWITSNPFIMLWFFL